jgi:tetratricopeptide (TPR) repeat protein
MWGRASILLIASQMLGRLGEPREAQRIAEDCLAIAERIGDPVLLCDSCNRLAVCLILSDSTRARELFHRALEIIVPLNDVFRRVRVLNNIGLLELSASRFAAARESLEAAIRFARSGKLLDLWARASLNLGVIAIRTGHYEEAKETLGEALRLGADSQQTDIQLIITYNLGYLARDQGDFRRAGEIFELAMELADRVGQFEVKAGALAGMAMCRLAVGATEQGVRIYEDLQPLAERLPDWFQGRELIEALRIHLSLRRSKQEAYELFTAALALAEARDVYGASWLVAEFGQLLHDHAPAAIEGAVKRYRGRPEILETPRIRERFGVLMFDGAEKC